MAISHQQMSPSSIFLGPFHQVGQELAEGFLTAACQGLSPDFDSGSQEAGAHQQEPGTDTRLARPMFS